MEDKKHVAEATTSKLPEDGPKIHVTLVQKMHKQLHSSALAALADLIDSCSVSAEEFSSTCMVKELQAALDVTCTGPLCPKRSLKERRGLTWREEESPRTKGSSVISITVPEGAVPAGEESKAVGGIRADGENPAVPAGEESKAAGGIWADGEDPAADHGVKAAGDTRTAGEDSEDAKARTHARTHARTCARKHCSCLPCLV